MASFNNIPTVTFSRSKQDLKHSVKTSMNIGYLYPIDWVEVLPGDTFINKTYQVNRLTSSFIKPVMDNLFLDVYHFFVPLRLTYDKLERVFGNPNPSAYIANELLDMPTIQTRPSDGAGVVSGSIADYLGLVPGVNYSNQLAGNDTDRSVIAAPFRAFALIYNNWFRNQQTDDEVFVHLGDTGSDEFINGNAWGPNNYTGMPPKINKLKDYFTSLLPSPQKGEGVGLFNRENAIPVNSTNVSHPLSGDKSALHFVSSELGSSPSSFQDSPVPNGSNIYLNTSGDTLVKYLSSGSVVPLEITPDNLWADTSQLGVNDVNGLRYAFALQKMLERDAIYGSRYVEYLAGHYGVRSPDARLQIPEYLGGARTPLNVEQVAQTSQGTNDSPLANVAGYSWSSGKSKYTKSFTEHGIVMTVACLRYKHTYQQGLSRKWTRKSRNDFYDPLFSTIGQQPVYKYEIYDHTLTDLNPQNAEILGYSEAWSSYRHIPNTVTGKMRSGVENSFDVWHFADYYDNAPTLSSSFTNETGKYVDRTISVSTDSIAPFILDFFFDLQAVRVMPVRSLPGLIDHH